MTVYILTDGRMGGWTDGWTDGRIDGWIDGRMDGRRDGRHCILQFSQTLKHQKLNKSSC